MAHESAEAEQSVACCGRSMWTPHAEGGLRVNRGESLLLSYRGIKQLGGTGVLNDVDSDAVMSYTVS